MKRSPIPQGQWLKKRLLIILLLTTVALILGLQTFLPAKHSPTPIAKTAPIAAMTFSPSLPPTVVPERLFRQVQSLAFERYTPTQRQQARDYIVAELHAAGWVPSLIPFQGGVNIVAQRPGQVRTANSLLVAAHYDTVAGSPGADDNASGVATVLEIAHLFAQQSTPRPLQLAFFDLEEQNLQGSFAFANDLQQRADLAGVIVLEMLGFACHTPGCQRQPQGLPITPPSDKGDFLVVVGDTEHLPLLQSFAPSPGLPKVLGIPTPMKGLLTPDLLRSDHAPFWYQEIGAVMVTDTANFRNPHYHQPSDTPETIDRPFLRGAAQLVVNATARLLAQSTPLTTSPP